jgi:hypothetical protein
MRTAFEFQFRRDTLQVSGIKPEVWNLETSRVERRSEPGHWRFG